MDSTDHRTNQDSALRLTINAFIGLALIGAGVASFLYLKSQKQEPVKTGTANSKVLVRGLRVVPQDQSFPVQAFGTVRAARTVSITPEVSGRVVAIHDRLRAGEVIAKNEMLVTVDSSRYTLKLAALKAQRSSMTANQRRLTQELANLQRLKTHSEELVKTAKADVERLTKLFENKVATSAEVDAARRQELSLTTQLIEIQGQIDLVPIKSKELLAQIETLDVEIRNAQLDIDQTVIRAPFEARVVESKLEVGDYVSIGRPVLTLNAARSHEIPVNITGSQLEELRGFLPIQAGTATAASPASQVDARHAKISLLLQGQKRCQWTGRIDRLEAVDPVTRMYRLIVKVDHDATESQALTLRMGMFCQVDLPGCVRKGVARVPREHIEGGRIAVESGGKLKFVDVEIVRTLAQGDALITGLKGPTNMITTRIPFAVEGMNVEIIVENEDQS